MEINDDLEKSLLGFKSAVPRLRATLLSSPPSGSRMASEYFALIQKLASDA